MAMKLHRVENVPGMLVFQCPACGNCHHFLVEGATRPAPRWKWNGSMDKPTFTPSLLVTSDTATPPVTPENLDEWKRAPWPQTNVRHICHSYVTDGKIQYLGDCTHSMAGQTVEIPEW